MRRASQKSLSVTVLADRMRPLQSFDSAKCTNERKAQVIVKRFRAFSELPLNLNGSGVLADGRSSSNKSSAVISRLHFVERLTNRESFENSYDLRSVEAIPCSSTAGNISGLQNARWPNPDAPNASSSRPNTTEGRNLSITKSIREGEPQWRF